MNPACLQSFLQHGRAASEANIAPRLAKKAKHKVAASPAGAKECSVCTMGISMPPGLHGSDTELKGSFGLINVRWPGWIKQSHGEERMYMCVYMHVYVCTEARFLSCEGNLH